MIWMISCTNLLNSWTTASKIFCTELKRKNVFFHKTMTSAEGLKKRIEKKKKNLQILQNTAKLIIFQFFRVFPILIWRITRDRNCLCQLTYLTLYELYAVSYSVLNQILNVHLYSSEWIVKRFKRVFFLYLGS